MTEIKWPLPRHADHVGVSGEYVWSADVADLERAYAEVCKELKAMQAERIRLLAELADERAGK